MQYFLVAAATETIFMHCRVNVFQERLGGLTGIMYNKINTTNVNLHNKVQQSPYHKRAKTLSHIPQFLTPDLSGAYLDVGERTKTTWAHCTACTDF